MKLWLGVRQDGEVFFERIGVVVTLVLAVYWSVCGVRIGVVQAGLVLGLKPRCRHHRQL
jgi:hypothetical protein